jgi:chromosome segregation ATPase
MATAAGLLICAAVYASLFLSGPGGVGKSQDESKVKSLVEELGHTDILKRDRAATELAALGSKSRPSLEEALKSTNEGIRVRARDVLDRITVPAAAAMTEQLKALDAECSAKAARINDLQRQLDAANTRLTKQETDQAVFERQLEVHLAQIAELQRQLEEAKKKK